MSGPTPTAATARVAVAALFFANGALFANVVPRYPELKAALDLSSTAFGSAVAAYGLGALVLGLLSGVLVSRFGSGRVAPISTIAIAANLVLVGVAPSWVTLSAALFVAGSLDATADLANNAHGLAVERIYRRSILNSLHGVWSIGAVVGGAMGAAAAGLEIPLGWHLSIAATLFTVLAVIASRFLLRGGHTTPGRAPDTHQPVHRRHRLRGLHIARSLLTLGVIAAMAQIMEDSTGTWSAVYLREDLGAAPAVSGLGFIALQAFQTAGRFFADRGVTRFGDRAIARTGVTVAGSAMAVALADPGITATVIGFAAVGLGIGSLIPASMRTADDMPGLPRGVGMSMVGTVDRVAILTAPLLIGVVADARSLRVGLIVIPVAAAVVLLLARALPTRHARSARIR